MIYKTRKDLIKALKDAPKGEKRSQILNIEQNRNLIKNSGANVTLYSGDVLDNNNPIQALDNIYIGVIQRLNAKTGYPDGIGALGGLSERTDEDKFNHMTISEKKQLLGQKDDVIIQNEKVVLTDDINIIRLNNVIRETKEELGNLGIYDFKLDKSQIHLIQMEDLKDDNFAINIWNGNGDVWCITPYCHILKTTEQTLDILANRSADIHKHEQNSEVAEYKKIKLTQALKSFGNFSGNNKLEDGRNANSDYRYPHEWFATWALASDLLNNDENKLTLLYKKIQLQTPWKISFKNAAQKMGKDLDFVAKTLNIGIKAIENIENLPTGTVLINSHNRSI
ncbi:MAG: hypothetical protein IJ019_02315 [Alphaproteobacteria bacterium]|nr:hypothetical protein [Alphaproteobacteria bacterium]